MVLFSQPRDSNISYPNLAVNLYTSLGQSLIMATSHPVCRLKVTIRQLKLQENSAANCLTVQWSGGMCITRPARTELQIILPVKTVDIQMFIQFLVGHETPSEYYHCPQMARDHMKYCILAYSCKLF